MEQIIPLKNQIEIVNNAVSRLDDLNSAAAMKGRGDCAFQNLATALTYLDLVRIELDILSKTARIDELGAEITARKNLIQTLRDDVVKSGEKLSGL